MIHKFFVREGETNFIGDAGYKEEAAHPRSGKDPRCPAAHERADHELIHLPLRFWRRACVEGRSHNKPHMSANRTHEVPSVLMDYAFVSKSDDEQFLTIPVTKDRDSRAIMAHEVMHKGRGEDEVVQHAVDNIRRLGHKRIVIKRDNELAPPSLLNAVVQALDIPAIAEHPPQGESQSCGSIENAVKRFQGDVASSFTFARDHDSRCNPNPPCSDDLVGTSCRRVHHEIIVGPRR